MARRPKASKPEGKSTIHDAIKFVSMVKKDIGSPYQTHVALWNKWAIATDGVVSAGHPIEDDLSACPHTATFLAALAKCGKTMSITQLDSNRIVVKSGKFKANVPCVQFSDMVYIEPNSITCPVNEEFKKCLSVVGVVSAENTHQIVTSSILLKANSAIATDRIIMIEYWHGLNLPELILPKAFAALISKIKEDIQSIGFDDQSCTVFLSNGAWLKTQLYTEAWPNTDRVFNIREPKPIEIHKDFFTAIDAVSSFCGDSGVLYFKDDRVWSHTDVDEGASMELSGIPNCALSSKRLAILNGLITLYDFGGNDLNQPAMFFGNKIRAVLSKVSI